MTKQEQAIEYLKRGLSDSEIISRGISRRTLSYAKMRGNIGYVYERRREEDNRRKEEYAKSEEVKSDLLKRVQSVEDTIDKLISSNSKELEPITPMTTGSESVAVLMWSDWHLGEVVDPDTVNGINSFNKEIASDRLDKLFKRSAFYIKNEKSNSRIDTVIVWLGGDIIHGELHDSSETNDMSATEACVYAQQKIVQGLRLIADETGCKITVITNVGNHGRNTKFTNYNTMTRHSYETMIYAFVAAALQDDKRFTFNISKGYHQYLEVFDYTLRFHHGDFMKYNGGVGGLTIPVNKAIAQWDKLRRADYDFFGHWHTYKQDTKWCSNGCVSGFGAFSLAIKADPYPPVQTLTFIEKTFGRTLVRPIFM